MPQADESCTPSDEPARSGLPMGVVMGWAVIAVALIGVAMLRRTRSAAAVLLVALCLGLAGCAGLEAIADNTLPATQADIDKARADGDSLAMQAADEAASGQWGKALGTGLGGGFLYLLVTIALSRRRRRVELAKQVVAEAEKAA